MNRGPLIKKVTGFIFSRLILCSVTMILLTYLLEHGNFISSTSIKAIILVFFAAALCLYAAVNITQYIRRLVDQSVNKLAEISVVLKETAANLRNVAERSMAENPPKDGR